MRPWRVILEYLLAPETTILIIVEQLDAVVTIAYGCAHGPENILGSL